MDCDTDVSGEFVRWCASILFSSFIRALTCNTGYFTYRFFKCSGTTISFEKIDGML
jgi:hypothetical protein